MTTTLAPEPKTTTPTSSPLPASADIEPAARIPDGPDAEGMTPRTRVPAGPPALRNEVITGWLPVLEDRVASRCRRAFGQVFRRPDPPRA